MYIRCNMSCYFSITLDTTRPPRSGEEPGIDYMFISREKFLEMQKHGDFLESGSYKDHYYGTPKPLLGHSVVKDKSKQTIKEEYKTDSNSRVVAENE